MLRILISQNENNDNTDYVVVDGQKIEDAVLKSTFHSEVTESYIRGKMLFEEENLRIKRFNNKYIIQSHYLDSDIIGRNIYYMFYFENNEKLDVEKLILYLKKDSDVLSRTIDKKDEKLILDNVGKNQIDCVINLIGKYKIKILVALGLGILIVALLTNKN